MKATIQGWTSQVIRVTEAVVAAGTCIFIPVIGMATLKGRSVPLAERTLCSSGSELVTVSWAPLATATTRGRNVQPRWSITGGAGAADGSPLTPGTQATTSDRPPP